MLLGVLFLSITSIQSHVFYFAPTNKISHRDNWTPKDKVCIDDHIVFEESENTLAYFDSDLLVSQVTLPNDGVLYFDDNVVLGRAGGLQCSKRKSPEESFFDAEVAFGCWLDPKNWVHDHDPVLHMNQVPSAADDVEFLNHSLQMYLEKAPKVRSLWYSGRSWTSAKFEDLLYTAEGQFKVALNHEIGKKSVLGDIEFNIPSKGQPMRIEKIEVDEWDGQSGVVNSNSDHSTLSKICQYVTCDSTTAICLEPVKPFGHCCDICGALVNFSVSDGNSHSIYRNVREHFLKAKLQDYMDIYMERMDPDSAPIEYQISLFPKHRSDDKLARFHEEKFNEAVDVIIAALDTHTGEVTATMLQHSSVVSKTDRSPSQATRTLGKIFFVFILGGIIFYVVDKDTPIGQRIRAIATQTSSNPSNFDMRVLWRRGSTEDLVQIDNPAFEASEDENADSLLAYEKSSTSSNITEAENETNVLVTKPSTDKEHLGGDVEMTLISL